MKIAIIQGSNAGFFPRFYGLLKQAIEDSGASCKLFVPNSGINKKNVLPNQTIWGTRFNWFLHYHLYKVTGRQDCYSWLSTLDLIQKLKAYKPDVIHLHVILQWQLNLPIFVNYLNNNHIPVVWTFHDCRVFTGGCPYFDEIGCKKWKSGCYECPSFGKYISSKNDNTSWVWNFRRKWISSIDNLTIVTPSKWLANFVSQSFLKNKKCHVIYNGVDLSQFSVPSSFDIRNKYNIQNDENIILGCAIIWAERKGLPYFKSIAHYVNEKYSNRRPHIILVGNISSEDVNELRGLGIKCIGCTETLDELISLYQNASVFVNPTLADNFPTTNIEALASGTPVITFKTGGSPEAIDMKTGIIIEKGNVSDLLSSIDDILQSRVKFSREECIIRSRLFSEQNYYRYVELYDSLVK